MNTSRLWTAQFTAIVIMAFLFFLCLRLLTAGFPAFITDIKNNPAQGGLMTTVFMVSAIAIRPFVPSLMQKMDNKKLSVISLGFIAISVALSFGQDSVALFAPASYFPWHWFWDHHDDFLDDGNEYHPCPPIGRGNWLLRNGHQCRDKSWTGAGACFLCRCFLLTCLSFFR